MKTDISMLTSTQKELSDLVLTQKESLQDGARPPNPYVGNEAGSDQQQPDKAKSSQPSYAQITSQEIGACTYQSDLVERGINSSYDDTAPFKAVNTRPKLAAAHPNQVYTRVVTNSKAKSSQVTNNLQKKYLNTERNLHESQYRDCRSNATDKMLCTGSAPGLRAVGQKRQNGAPNKICSGVFVTRLEP